MRIPDYRNVLGGKDLNRWTTKISRIDKAHEDEFEKELEDSIHKRKSEAKLEIDRLFAEYDKKIKSETNIDLDEQIPNSNDQFSSWA